MGFDSSDDGTRTDPEPHDAPYRQCVLTRGRSTRTTWLPACHAVPGAVLRLRDGGHWTDGWVVKSAGAAAPYRDLVRKPDLRAAGRGVCWQPRPAACLLTQGPS